MKNQIMRQGDVLLVAIETLPEDAVVQIVEGDVILAWGEVTLHAHRIKEPDMVRMWSAGAERFLQVLERTALTHEEHTAITLEPGIYRLPQQTEYTPAELRRVQD